MDGAINNNKVVSIRNSNESVQSILSYVAEAAASGDVQAITVIMLRSSIDGDSCETCTLYEGNWLKMLGALEAAKHDMLTPKE